MANPKSERFREENTDVFFMQIRQAATCCFEENMDIAQKRIWRATGYILQKPKGLQSRRTLVTEPTIGMC